jgi:hypothetical protein
MVAGGPTDKVTSNTVVLDDTPMRAFQVAFSDVAPEVDYSDEAVAHEAIDAGVANYAEARKHEVREKSKIKLGKHYGQECMLEYPRDGSKILLRVYLVGHRMYMLSSGWSPKEGQNSEDAEKFMNSFKVTD